MTLHTSQSNPKVSLDSLLIERAVQSLRYRYSKHNLQKHTQALENTLITQTFHNCGNRTHFLQSRGQDCPICTFGRQDYQQNLSLQVGQDKVCWISQLLDYNKKKNNLSRLNWALASKSHRTSSAQHWSMVGTRRNFWWYHGYFFWFGSTIFSAARQ